MVAAPSKIRSNQTYRIGISSQDLEGPAKMQISIMNTDDNSTVYSETADLNENQTHLDLDYQTGALKRGFYTIQVKGLDGLEFDEKEFIFYDPKVLSIFVQTDKAIYKPGQKIKFRVILINSELESVGNHPLNIHIEDSKRNRIKQWKKKTTVNGLFSGELQLSSEPLLGDWKMFIDAGQNQIKTHDVTIAEYVLPKVEVKIKLPPFATFNDSKIVATVEAKYTYGKSVKGIVKFEAEHKRYYYNRNSENKFEYSGLKILP